MSCSKNSRYELSEVHRPVVSTEPFLSSKLQLEKQEGLPVLNVATPTVMANVYMFLKYTRGKRTFVATSTLRKAAYSVTVAEAWSTGPTDSDSRNGCAKCYMSLISPLLLVFFYFMVEFVPLYCQFVLLSVLLKRITMTFSQ